MKHHSYQAWFHGYFDHERGRWKKLLLPRVYREPYICLTCGNWKEHPLHY